MPLTKAEARRVALSFPGTTEGPHYGKPAIFLSGEFLTRVHDKEDAVVLITSGIEMRDIMLEAEPALFYITDHYRNRPALLARLKALDAATLRDLLRARIGAVSARPAKKTKKKKTGKKVAPKKAGSR